MDVSSYSLFVESLRLAKPEVTGLTMLLFCLTSKAGSDIAIGSSDRSSRVARAALASIFAVNNQRMQLSFAVPFRSTELKIPRILEETFASAAL
jgi:hypothetical protein